MLLNPIRKVYSRSISKPKLNVIYLAMFFLMYSAEGNVRSA